MTQVWRINLKPEPEHGVDPQLLCLNKGILGIGWQVEWTGMGPDWDTYYKLAKEKYYDKDDKGWMTAINALYSGMQIDDLCWTRTKNGEYYLGRITSKWRYESGTEFKKADIVNVRDCEWHSIGTVDSVPGKVVRSFIPSRTVQKVMGETVELFSKFRYNQLSGTFTFDFSQTKPDLFSLLSTDDCEDIVGLYLQTRGYNIVPSSCKTDTLAYEYVMINRESGRRAVAQVKNGNVDIDMTLFSSEEQDAFLFTTSGRYTGQKAPNVYCIDRREIEQFIHNNSRLLPGKIKTWIDFYDRLLYGNDTM